MIDQAVALERSKLGTGRVLTYGGGSIAPLDPKVEDIDPIAIAHALSQLVRYTGHGAHWYSVAEHSVILHDYLARSTSDTRLLKTMLLHDADEHAMIDLPAPLKHHPDGFGKAFKEAAVKIQEVIAERFDLIVPEPPIIKELDVRLRTNEMEDLFPDHDIERVWGEPLDVTIHHWTPTEAKMQFIWRLANHGVVERDHKGRYVAV